MGAEEEILVGADQGVEAGLEADSTPHFQVTATHAVDPDILGAIAAFLTPPYGCQKLHLLSTQIWTGKSRK